MENEWLPPFKELLTARTGLRISEHADGPMAAHIKERTAQLSLNSTIDYYRLIASGSKEGNDEIKSLVKLLAIGESYFFRDKGQFRLLRDVLIPDLIKKRSALRELRIWSAGCSTGEEAYSLAMLLGEIMRDKDGWRISIIGTDIREDLLDKAKAGVYGNWSFRQVDGSVKARYFKEKNGSLALDPRIKETVSFFSLDLLEDALPDNAKGLYNLDLILCRNVFIYYDSRAVIKMVSKMINVLNYGGYLMTAHGELFSMPLRSLKLRAFTESLIYEKTAPEDPAAVVVRPADKCKESAPIKRLANHAKTIAAPIPEAQAQAKEAAYKIEDIRSLFSRGLYSSAIAMADASLKSNPDDFHLLYLSGAAYANTGDTKKAKEWLLAASKADPLAPEPYYLLALIAEQDGDHPRAKEVLNKIMYLRSGFVAAYIELASIYESEGDVDRARRLRLAALAEVRSLPVDSQIEMYDSATAGEIEAYLNRLTGA
ncbi:MAG: CheR family methyltransferase [Deltaproteobacteria bacterium]